MLYKHIQTQTAASASSSGAVRVRCLAQEHLNTQARRSRDRTSNLAVTSQPAPPSELMPPLCGLRGWNPALIGWLAGDTWGPLGSRFHAEAPSLDHLHLQTPVSLGQPDLHVSCSKTNAPSQYISPDIKQTNLHSSLALSVSLSLRR